MSAAPTADRPRPALAPYGFAGVAAAAMVATLPGRTHGLGLVTEPLLRDFDLGRVPYAVLNLWATLLGALFCVPCGWLLDRVGVRAVLSVTLLALGGVVVGMSRAEAGGDAVLLPAVDLAVGGGEWVGVPAGLFVLVLLTRGLGQSALSVVSLALLGKAAGRTPGPVVGVYSFLVSVGFMAAFGAVKVVLEQGGVDWRTLWAGIGWTVLGAGGVSALLPLDLTRTTGRDSPRPAAAAGYTLGAALRTPAFWVFGLATSLYGLIAAGVSLFNQSLLEERGFDRRVFLTISTAAPLVGLAANLGTGWLARHYPLGRLLAAGMVILAAALLSFPRVDSLAGVYAYAAAMGVAGGMVTVLFFAVWGQAFGPRHLGQIQGAAQFLTVLASAAGPLLMAASHRAAGSYTPLFGQLAVAALVLAAAAWFVPMPLPPTPAPDGDPR